jgi:hypothetical protein
VPELLGRLPDGRARLAYPGVVHEAVDAPELGHGEVDERGAGVRIGDVGRPGAHFSAPGPDLARYLLEPLGAPSREHDMATDRGDGVGEANAEPRGRASDDDDPVIETERLQWIHHVLRVRRARVLDRAAVKDHYAT